MDKVVYICSPYRGNVEFNAFNACVYSKFAIQRGCVPLAPHLLFPQFLDDGKPEDRELALNMNMALLDRCDELWVFGSQISAGMGMEINRAKEKQMEIKYFEYQLDEVENG